jgi:hypothetical protein
MNVRDADATLILHRGPLEGGTLKTLQACWEHDKPVRVLELGGGDALERAAVEVRAFLDEEKPAVLNVAGPRASKDPGIYLIAREVLSRAFS